MECHREKSAQYRARAEVKAKNHEYHVRHSAKPEIKARRSAYAAKYNARPEVKEKNRERNARLEVKVQRAAYRASPEGKAKHRELDLKQYGLTNAQTVEMLAIQGNRCAICRTDNPGGRHYWHVDHDHETGLVRGLLCNRCNLGLGHLRDSVDLLQRAIAYLEEAKRYLADGGRFKVLLGIFS